jgi:phosphoribosylformylglycinamidine synthase
VAVIREEGSNGDREMAAAFYSAGFEVHDVCMQDLLDGRPNSLDAFRGCAFVGGFSYADVLGSAKGWSAAIKFSPKLSRLFRRFLHERTDTFSLGVCNGCQLMALLGIVKDNLTDPDNQEHEHPPNIHLRANACARFNSYFASVRVEQTAAIMLMNMAESVLGVWCSNGEGACSDFEFLGLHTFVHSLFQVNLCIAVLRYCRRFALKIKSPCAT